VETEADRLEKEAAVYNLEAYGGTCLGDGVLRVKCSHLYRNDENCEL